MIGARQRDAILLGAIVIVTRLPFVTHLLWEWDSVLYAHALEQGFHVSADLADQRPHPPGYALYVATATVFRLLFGDSNAALVAVAVLASGAAAAAVYLLARRFASREVAAFAALAFAADPLVWAHGEIALPYIVLAVGSCGLALLFWDARRGSERQAIAASVAFGIAAGFRQDLLLLLGPLWLWSMAGGGPRRILLGAAVVAAACLVWLVPSALLSGGLGAYAGAVLSQSGSITGTSAIGASGGDVLWYDVRFTVLALAWGLFATGVVLVGLLLAPALHWLSRPALRRPGDTTTFFLLWIAPALAVYLLWIIGDWGYVLSIVPALYVLCAALLARALARAHGPAVVVARAALLALVAGTALFFVLSDARWSAALLAAHDRGVTERVANIRGHYPPAATVLLAREDYQLARYYLPEYRAWLYDPTPARSDDPPKTIPASLVIFTPDLVLRQGAGATVRLFGIDPVARER